MSVKFLGHVIDQEGIKPDPEKAQAIREMGEPKSLSDLRRFLGMCNQFSLELADATKPLQDLLSNKNQWVWEQPQQRAFHTFTLPQFYVCMICQFIQRYQLMLRLMELAQHSSRNREMASRNQWRAAHGQ